MDLILKAAVFAKKAHEGQYRKYNNKPYIEHPARVAGLVAIHPEANEEMVAAAFLHDVVEDTSYTFDDIINEFGDVVAKLVIELTNPSKGSKAPRYERKQMDLRHLMVVSREAKIIKLIDRIDNLREMSEITSITKYSNQFLKLYCNESKSLAEAIGSVDFELKDHLFHMIEVLNRIPNE